MAQQFTLPILDVSRYDANSGNGTYVPIDYSQAKSKWGGVIIKAAEAYFVDVAYDEQVAAARQNLFADGAYYLFRTYYDALRGADLFCDLIERNGGYGVLGCWLDAEYNNAPLTGTQYLAQMKTWLARVKDRMIAFGANAPIGIYTRNSFIDPLWSEAGRPTWIRSYPYMQAWYKYGTRGQVGFETMYEQIVHQNFLPDIPTASLALGPCAIHQWTDKGRPADVPGYPPYKLSVDFSVVYRKFWSDPVPSEPTDEEKLDRLWAAHPELH